MLTELCSLTHATGAAVDDDRGCVWFTQKDGTLGSVALDGTVTVHQTLGSEPASIALGGPTIVVSHPDGDLSFVDPDDPGVVASQGQAPPALGQVAITSGAKQTAVAVSRSRRRLGPTPPFLPARGDTALVAVSVATGATTTRPISGLTGVAVDGSAVYVATNDLLRRGRIGQSLGTTVKTLASGLPAVGRVGLADAGSVVLAAHPQSQRLSAFRPATGTVDTRSTTSLTGRIIEAHGLADGRIVLLTDSVLALVDSLADLTQEPTIEPLGAPLFVASWARLSFDLGTTGLGPDDVHFEVPDGPEAGFVSYTRENGVGDPVPLLVAGGLVGPHKVELVENASANVLAAVEFEVTDHWSDSETGPSGFYTATTDSFDGGGWGGGPSSPQNVGVHQHVGEWRVLVLMVDTSDRRWPTDAPTMTANQNAILGHTSTGASFGGQTRSARQYYEENSQFAAASGGSPAKGLTISVHNNTTFGPVSLPGPWTDYFQQKVAADGTVTDDRWTSKGATLQTIITRSISDGVTTAGDWAAIDSVVLVPFSADAVSSAGAKFVWPHAHRPEEFLCGTNPMTDKRTIGKLYAPLDFDVHDGRQMHSTMSHELGHTLGLPDLYSFPEYSDDIDSRLTSDWDLMAGSRDTLPHYTVANKMQLGWVPAPQIKLFNFQGSGAISQQVTLHAAELGDPPGGQFKAIEIRLGDGWNYYVEYRAEQGGQVSDDLPTDRRVVITDVTSETFTAPLARPQIVFVRNDIDGDGPLLGTGSDLEEKDPGTQQDLTVEVISTAADNAVVKVSYGANGKPEPGIRPWDGGPDWQSPDIEVRNDKATADPGKYFNTPWLGHDNTIVAKVRNNGDLLATGVVVDFFVTEYSSGDGPWIPLGFDKQDIGPGATVEFKAGWNPSDADDRHYCVIVRIRLYQDPGNLAVVDQNIYNNEARSNYTQFVSSSASPSSRVGARVLLANPFSDPTQVFAEVQKTHRQHRVFVDHQWLRVPGKDQRAVTVWDEAVWGTPEWALVSDGEKDREPSYLWEVPNKVSITGWAVRPFEADCGSRTLTGGVGMRVDAGRATRIELRAFTKGYVTGQVVYLDNGSGVTSGGTVLVEVSDGARSFTTPADVGNGGHFAAEFRNEFGDDTKWGEAGYLGSYGAAASTTGKVTPT